MCTQPSKQDPQKRGSKNVDVGQALLKNAPPGPLINSWFFFLTKERGKHGSPIFVFSFWGPYSSRKNFFCLSKIYSQVFFWNSKWVAQKTGKKTNILVVSWLFFPFGLLMVTFRLHIPCCLQMCHSSLFLSFFVRFFFFAVVVFHCFFPNLSLLCSLLFVLLFVFPAFSLCGTKTRSNHWEPNNLKLCFLMFCFDACILPLSLGADNNPYTRPREQPLKMVVVCLVFSFVLQKWSSLQDENIDGDQKTQLN